MRRWYFGAVALLSLSALAPLGHLLFSSASDAQEKSQPTTAPKLARSRIDKVTVYPSNALVTREVDVPEGAGLIELVIAPMPDQIVPSTMYSEGGDGIRVLTTRFSTRQVLEDTSEERRKLEAEKEKIMVSASKIAAEIGTIQKNLELLSKLESVTEKSKLTGDEVITVSKYVMEQRAEKAKEMVALQEQKRLNVIQMNFNQRKMTELGGGSGRMEREAVIVVDREAGKGGKVRLNYLVDAVAWRPEYKLRAGKINEDVEVNYLGSLMQHSGEDWNQVKMTLSTAQPMLNASPPELSMLQPILVVRGTAGAPPMPGGAGFAASAWAVPNSALEGLAKKAMTSRANANQINAGQGGMMGMQGGMAIPMPTQPAMPGTNPAPVNPFGNPSGFGAQGGNFYPQAQVQQDANRLLNEAASLEQNLDLMRSRDEVLAEAKRRKNPGAAASTGTDGPSATFHLTSKLTVPSRNEEQIIEVVKLNLAPKYYYKTVPVLSSHVYRLADLVNKSSHILLPGEATMYQGSDFVGRMPMPLVAVGEEFTAGFGVDTQLQIQRQMVDQVRTTQGGNQVLTYDYRILVNSFKSEPVKLQVWDRLPKGATESVNISLLKTVPELCKDAIYLRESRPNNLLRWDVDVAGNCNGEKALPITYEFRMELDRQLAISGFQSR